MPKRFQKASISDYAQKQVDWIQTLDWGKAGYFLSGRPGCGKTHLACTIMRQRMKEKETQSAYFISAPMMLCEIRATFNDRSSDTELKLIERYCKYEILLLDDVGAEKITDWSAATMYCVISQREAWLRDTIVTSNQKLDDIEEWEPRIASRLAGYGQIGMKDMDRRIEHGH